MLTGSCAVHFLFRQQGLKIQRSAKGQKELDLNEPSSEMSSQSTIDLTDEDEELRKAITMSQESVTSVETVGFGILGINRKAMEEERLARNANRNRSTALKRPRSISPPPLDRPSKIQKTAARVLATTDVKIQSPLQYPNGIIKKTWSAVHPRAPTDIKIEEVLERDTLRTALLSAFKWDMDWLFSKLAVPSTKLIFVMEAKNAATRTAIRQDAAKYASFLRLCFPPMEGGVNCMHSKLMLLFHAHKLRVVVPSANLVSYDWGETGVMENSVFLIDLPRLSGGEKRGREEMTEFGRNLMFFLDKSGVDEDVKEGALNFDFEKTKGLAFVCSVGGPSYGDDMPRTGFLGLNKGVRELGFETQDLEIDFAASSIGSLKVKFLEELYRAATGQAIPPARKETNDSITVQRTKIHALERIFRIYFPTHETVASSIGGTDNGGTICHQSQWWHASSFPRPLFRDYESTRSGLLSHNKLLCARGWQRLFDLDGEDEGRAVAWVYTGSANLSASAWGTRVFDRVRKEWKINCRNWECGVIVPVSVPDSGLDTNEKVPEMGCFKGVLDLPFVYPGRQYEGREPWFKPKDRAPDL
ncbi:hypothetical protein LTR66_011849 [Elasticomyces elasticus]|nr:hypothetical protein LTR66_011849 [Elasticomyces elasticus]